MRIRFGELTLWLSNYGWLQIESDSDVEFDIGLGLTELKGTVGRGMRSTELRDTS